ncbi:HNH endonuclease signature motif containing protein [Rhodococcus aetherivorans]|uniref:HNH endonuclease signature motif containing protein n=1 Tax=Rhodococcus aetherivorans TaxID=191292 RepID=UPI0026EFA7F2|nr:HNH endonuclease signature motif containing protein [Rhodococcus aetherivorans]WKX00956.1 HNH endonuclease signature motif containing protein [Rhodococcus aetherivorans]
MPTAPPRQCDRCRRTFTGSRCPCRKAWEGSTRTGQTSGTNSRRWRRLRERILQESPLCSTCQRELATVLDHRVPVAEGGAMWSESNLQGLCRSCSDRKTQEEAQRGRRRRR